MSGTDQSRGGIMREGGKSSWGQTENMFHNVMAENVCGCACPVQEATERGGGFMTAVLLVCLPWGSHGDVMWLNITGSQWRGVVPTREPERWRVRDVGGGRKEDEEIWRGEKQIDGAERKLFAVVVSVSFWRILHLPSALGDTQWQIQRQGHTVIPQWWCKSRFLWLFSLLMKWLLLSIQFAHKWNH